MINNFKINLEQINGFVNIEKKFKEKIKEKILLISPIYKFADNIKITSVGIGHFLNKNNSFIKIKNLIEILKKLKINSRDIETKIIGYKDANREKVYKINFPYHFTPIDMRIISVLIGDGNIGKKNNLLRWIQKDVSPLQKLINKKTNFDKLMNNKEQLVIPSFFGKVSTHIFNLNLFELGTYKLIEKSFDLPKNYRLALLLALIEDEGNIDAKNYSGINIRMSDKEVITSLKQLCESLEYKTSKIIEYKNNLDSKNNGKMYKLYILSDGIFKLGYDILEFEKKFGNFAGLWKKRKNFFKRWKNCNSKKAIKDRKGRETHQKIVKLFKINKELSLTQIANELRMKNNKVSWQLKNMYKRGEIKRIKHGIYMSKKI